MKELKDRMEYFTTCETLHDFVNKISSGHTRLLRVITYRSSWDFLPTQTQTHTHVHGGAAQLFVLNPPPY